MALANRKTLGERSARDRQLRKGIPTLAEMAPIIASEEAAVGYLELIMSLQSQPAHHVVDSALEGELSGSIVAKGINIQQVW